MNQLLLEYGVQKAQPAVQCPEQTEQLLLKVADLPLVGLAQGLANDQRRLEEIREQITTIYYTQFNIDCNEISIDYSRSFPL